MKPLEPKKVIQRLSQELIQHLSEKNISNPVLVGVRTGGVWVAQALAPLLGYTRPLDELDINFYRDDFSRVGLNPNISSSLLTQPIEDNHIILIDDVIGTGRTGRAALNEIFDFGRPASITLVVLIDRGGRELPFQPDIVGERVILEPNQNIKLRGPSPLRLEIITSKE